MHKPMMMKRATMTTIMVLYSLFRKANAPSLMNPEISVILSVPVGAFLIHEARQKATIRPIAAAMTGKN